MKVDTQRGDLRGERGGQDEPALRRVRVCGPHDPGVTVRWQSPHTSERGAALLQKSRQRRGSGLVFIIIIREGPGIHCPGVVPTGAT